MVRYKLITLLALLLLFWGCKQQIQRPILVWKAFPYNRFFSYGDTAYQKKCKFVSTYGDTINIDINDYRATKDFVIGSPLAPGYAFGNSEGETYIFDSRYMVGDHSNSYFMMLGSVMNRYCLGFSITVNLPQAQQKAKYFASIPIDSAYLPSYMPSDPELLATYLTDTITLYDENGADAAKIVAGRGLITFTDINGVVWKRVL
jgi:lipoprotein